MSKAGTGAPELVGLDRAVEYVKKLEEFRAAFQLVNRALGDTAGIESGRKFDKVFLQTPAQRMGRYMVDRNSWVIYGIKSWAQVNPRRIYGTLDTVDQWDWAPYYATPKSGTDAEKTHTAREEQITKNFKKRGRPRKSW